MSTDHPMASEFEARARHPTQGVDQLLVFEHPRSSSLAPGSSPRSVEQQGREGMNNGRRRRKAVCPICGGVWFFEAGELSAHRDRGRVCPGGKQPQCSQCLDHGVVGGGQHDRSQFCPACELGARGRASWALRQGEQT